MKERKRITKAKALLLCAAVLLGAAAYHIGAVYVWGVWRAERELSDYAREALKLQEEIDCGYDWHNDRYLARNDLGFTLDYRRRNNTIHDERFSDMESERASKDYAAVRRAMPEELTLPEHITVWTEISAKDDTRKAQRLYLLRVINRAELPEKDSLLRPAEIAMDVIARLGESYHFTGIQMSYFDRNGMYEIVIPLDSFEQLTLAQLTGHTERIKGERYPEDYSSWFAENHVS